MIIMKFKPLPYILLICSVVFIALFFMLTPTYITANGDMKHFEDNDYSFDLPNNWTVYEYDDPIKTPFLSSNPSSIILNPTSKKIYNDNQQAIEQLENSTDVINTSATNVTDVYIVKADITKMDRLPDGVSFEEAYKSDSIYGVMGSSGQFNLDSSEAITVSGKKAMRFNYNVGSTSYRDTWVESNGHYYRFLGQCPSGIYSEVSSAFDTIEGSWVIK